MKTSELILKQVILLRECFDDYRQEAENYADAKNKKEEERAKAALRLIDADLKKKYSNEELRDAYIHDETKTESQDYTRARELRDASAKKVEVEISVLSALKQIAQDTNFDDSLLAKYDLSENEDGI